MAKFFFYISIFNKAFAPKAKNNAYLGGLCTKKTHTHTLEITKYTNTHSELKANITQKDLNMNKDSI